MKIFWIKLSHVIYDRFFGDLMEMKKTSIVFTPNPEILLKSREDKEFKNFLKQADYLLPDGIGLYIAAQIVERRKSKEVVSNKDICIDLLMLPYYFFNLFFRRNMLYAIHGERVCGSDLTMDVVKYAQQNKITIVIVDLFNPKDKKKVHSQKKFTRKLKERFPWLGFDYYIYKPGRRETIIEEINNSKAKILFSTLGMKIQEQSVIEIMKACPWLQLGLGIGSSFDYVTGFQKRAPKWMRMIGIEWLYRIVTGPQKIKRLHRLWNAIFVFLRKVIKEK